MAVLQKKGPQKGRSRQLSQLSLKECWCKGMSKWQAFKGDLGKLCESLDWARKCQVQVLSGLPKLDRKNWSQSQVVDLSRILVSVAVEFENHGTMWKPHFILLSRIALTSRLTRWRPQEGWGKVSVAASKVTMCNSMFLSLDRWRAIVDSHRYICMDVKHQFSTDPVRIRERWCDSSACPRSKCSTGSLETCFKSVWKCLCFLKSRSISALPVLLDTGDSDGSVSLYWGQALKTMLEHRVCHSVCFRWTRGYQRVVV